VEPEKSGVGFVRADILWLSQVVDAIRGQDAIVHLAAIPHPLNDPPQRVFEVNVMGTFNVLQAAHEEGVRRVVFASSDSTLGLCFGAPDRVPHYLPIDECHPLEPEDPYGLSKLIGEEICRAYARLGPMSVVALRPAWVWTKEEKEELKPLVEDPAKWVFGLWAYVDARDLARAFRLALEADGLPPFDVFLISADDNGTREESIELVRRYLPAVKDIRRQLRGRESLIDTAKAKRMLGFAPRYTWRDIL